MPTLSATAVQVAGLGEGPREVTLLEAEWAARPFPERYVLRSGRWPMRAGEIVLADPDDGRSPPSVVAAFGGAARWRTVGVADDRFARTPSLLAGPGTWATLSPRLASSFAVLRGQPALFWAGDAQKRVVAAVAELARSRSGADTATTVAATLSTRQQVMAGERSALDRSPAGYTIPAWLLPFAAAALAFGLNDRRLRRALALLTERGVARAAGAARLSLAVGGWCLALACAGAIAGTGVGLVARAVVSDLRSLPAGPTGEIAVAVAQLLGGVAIGATACGLLLWAGGRTAAPLTAARSRRATRMDSSHRTRARALLALVAWCVSALVALEVDSPSGAMVFAGVLAVALLLVTPELVDLAVTVGAALGYLTLLDTLVRTANDQIYPDVLPGQLLVADRSAALLPAPASVLRVVERSEPARSRSPLELHYLYELDRRGDPVRAVALDGYPGSLIAVESPHDVQRLTGRRLSAGQVTVLRQGGLLLWADRAFAGVRFPATGRLAITRLDKPDGKPQPIAVEAVTVSPAGWRVGTSGVTLTSTAVRRQLPTAAGPMMYSGLSDGDAREIRTAVAQAGLDARTVQIHQAPAPAVPPAALGVTAVGLVIVALLASLVATRGQGRALSRYLSRLIAIGLPAGWARHVLLCQQAVIVAAATVVGAIIAGVPVVLLSARISGVELSVPWTQALLLLACVYGAVCIGTLHSTRRLEARADDPYAQP